MDGYDTIKICPALAAEPERPPVPQTPLPDPVFGPAQTFTLDPRIYEPIDLSPPTPPTPEPPPPPTDEPLKDEDGDPYLDGPYDTFEGYEFGTATTMDKGFGWAAPWVVLATHDRSVVATDDFLSVLLGQSVEGTEGGEGWDGPWVEFRVDAP